MTFPEPVNLMDYIDLDCANLTYVWDQYIACGLNTVFTAYPKTGKSTLMAHLLKVMGKGGDFLGYTVIEGRALVLTEEAAPIWKARHELIDLGNWISVYDRSQFLGDEWADICEGVSIVVERDGYDLVVIDTFAKFGQVEDENNASQVNKALDHLDIIRATGAAVVPIHHNRKSEGKDTQGIRGSSAFAGEPDSIIELSKTGQYTRKLKLTTRIPTVPPADINYELSEDHRTISVVGDAGSFGGVYQRRAEIVEIVTAAPDGMTAPEIRNALSGCADRSASTIKTDLWALVHREQLRREGEGKATRYFGQESSPSKGTEPPVRSASDPPVEAQEADKSGQVSLISRDREAARSAGPVSGNGQPTKSAPVRSTKSRAKS